MDEDTHKPDDGQATPTAPGIDAEALTDYEKAKAEGKLFSSQDANRIHETITEGESSWSKWPKQRGGK